VGWQQPTTSGYDVLTGNNLVSLSGMYFTDYHKAVTIKNIKETIEDANISDVDFNAHLERLQKAAINRVLNGVFNRDQIIENLQLYTRRDLKDSTLVTNENKFVGIHLNLANDSSFALRLNSMSLLFNEAKTFNMYCFHSAKGLIWTKSVTVVANQETIVNVSDLIMSITELTYKAGEFLIGYMQDDLDTCKAIEYDPIELNKAMMFGHRGFEAVATSNVTYDVETLVHNYQNYGINLELTSVRDFTQVICRNAQSFDEAVGLQVAIDVIESIINSTRSNATERLTKDFLAQLYNDLSLDTQTDNMPYSAGLKNRLKRELNRLNKTFFPTDKVTIIQ